MASATSTSVDGGATPLRARAAHSVARAASAAKTIHAGLQFEPTARAMGTETRTPQPVPEEMIVSALPLLGAATTCSTASAKGRWTRARRRAGHEDARAQDQGAVRRRHDEHPEDGEAAAEDDEQPRTHARRQNAGRDRHHEVRGERSGADQAQRGAVEIQGAAQIGEQHAVAVAGQPERDGDRRRSGGDETGCRAGRDGERRVRVAVRSGRTYGRVY